MQIKGIRIYVVIAAVVMTLAVLLTIQFAHQRYNIEQPLFKLYSQSKMVKGVKIEEKGPELQVILDVRQTDNLRQTYQDLITQTEEIMGNGGFVLKLRDNRTEELEEAYYQSQFAIYEALAKGDYTKMADVIRQNGEKVGGTARVFIDDNNIYVEFTKGKNYFYEIVPREKAAQGSIADRMGSEQR